MSVGCELLTSVCVRKYWALKCPVYFYVRKKMKLTTPSAAAIWCSALGCFPSAGIFKAEVGMLAPHRAHVRHSSSLAITLLLGKERK